MKNVNSIVKLKDEDINKLRVDYNKELKEEVFKNFINYYKIKDSVGYKYTSSLKEACCEKNNCKNCKGLLECKNKVEGFCYTPFINNNIIDFSYVSCKYENKYLKDNKYQEYVTLFDIPKEIKEASLKNVYKDDKNRVPILKYIKEFINNYENSSDQKGLYLSGSFGSGKTYLLAAMFNELAKKEVNSIIVYFPEFLRKLKTSFSENTFDDKFDLIKKADLLLIDDIGAENLTAWGRDEVLGVILQYRMDEKLPTFFTSNLSLDELEEHLSLTSGGVDKVKARRLIERIKQLTENLELISKNRRN